MLWIGLDANTWQIMVWGWGFWGVFMIKILGIGLVGYLLFWVQKLIYRRLWLAHLKVSVGFGTGHIFEGEQGELAFLRADFHGPDSALTHRDILGSLMGLGVARERVGDILVGEHSADIVASPSLRDFFLREWAQAGRVRLTVAEIGREDLLVPVLQVKNIRDTVSSLRLDAVLSSAFSMSRGRAAELIAAGRVSLDHVPCVKGDKLVSEGSVLSVRGLGRAKLTEVGGLSRKGRTGITIERYL